MNLQPLIDKETARWNGARINSASRPLVVAIAHNLCADDAVARYTKVSAATRVPWPVIAVAHERESSQSWKGGLAQGDPWNKVSTHVPRGIGPFASWDEAAIYALVHCSPFLARWTDWSIGGALVALEAYNGFGYYNRGVPSPYIWSMTNRYVRGKYIADGHYDANAVDRQIGCAALLMAMGEVRTDMATYFKGYAQ